MKKKILIGSVLATIALAIVSFSVLHPVQVFANPFAPASTRVSPALQAEIEARYPGVTVVEIELDFDGFDLYLSNGRLFEVSYLGMINPNSQSWDGEYLNPLSDRETNGSVIPNQEDRYIPATELPEEVLAFINTNYPEQTIVMAEIDDDGYDVYLSNGIEIEFDFNGRIDVDMQDDDDRLIDASSLPQVIRDYITTNYPNASIRYVEIDAREYNLYLDNGVELYFDLNGNLLEIDQD